MNTFRSDIMKFLKSGFLAIVMVLTGTSVYGQDNATAEVSAIVLADISIAHVSDISFGSINSDLTDEPSIVPTDGSSTNQQGTVQVGRFLIDATAGASIILDADATATLNAGGGENITFTASLSGAEGDAGTASGGLTITNNQNVTLDPAESQYTVWVGGELSTTDGSLPAGNYTADDYTVSVEYDL